MSAQEMTEPVYVGLKRNIRIPVVVGPNGKWAAYGWTGITRAEAEEVLHDMMDGSDEQEPYRLSWVIAEVPLPEIREDEVTGSVEA